MAIEPYEEHWPEIADSAFVAASADVIGRVTIGEEASIWYNTTLRGDINEIVMGPRSNVQDNAVLHLADDYGCYLGELVTVGHGAIVHACEIRDEVLVGMGAVVLDGAVIGERSIIGANALVTGGMEIPPGSLVLGSPAKVVRTLERDEQAGVKQLGGKICASSGGSSSRGRGIGAKGSPCVRQLVRVEPVALLPTQAGCAVFLGDGAESDRVLHRAGDRGVDQCGPGGPDVAPSADARPDDGHAEDLRRRGAAGR